MIAFLKRYRSNRRDIEDGKLDGATDAEKESAVEDLIRTSCAAAATLALQPVPFLDTPALVPIHVKLVQDIARLHGERMESGPALGMIWTLRAGVAKHHATMAAAKFVPWVGWLVAVSAAHGLTYSIGQAMALYFRRHHDVDPGEMKDCLKKLYKEDFERVYRRGRTELRAKMGRAPAVRSKLRDLDAQCREGRIDEREKERRREAVLDAG